MKELSSDDKYGWHDLLALLDTTGASRPVSRSVSGMLTAAKNKEWIMLGALGRNAKTLALGCNDAKGRHLVFVFQAISEIMQGRAKECVFLLDRARGYFASCPDPSDRQNQGVILSIIGILAEGAGYHPTAAFMFCYAVANLARARIHLAETGDREGYNRLSSLYGFLSDWIERATRAPDCNGGRTETEEERWAPITCPAGDNGGVVVVGRTRSEFR